MNHKCTRRSMLQLLGITIGAAVIPAPLVEPSGDEPTEAKQPLASPTQLEQFIRSRGIKPAHLARESGYSRQHLRRLRLGRMLPSLPCIAALTIAARRLTREPVTPLDLFERDAITTAITCCARTLQDHEREAIIAAFGRRALLQGDRS
jgi:transcriptional regulator with XRE-family HTH domain